jgi:hypothetical protein
VREGVCLDPHCVRRQSHSSCTGMVGLTPHGLTHREGSPYGYTQHTLVYTPQGSTSAPVAAVQMSLGMLLLSVPASSKWASLLPCPPPCCASPTHHYHLSQGWRKLVVLEACLMHMAALSWLEVELKWHAVVLQLPVGGGQRPVGVGRSGGWQGW